MNLNIGLTNQPPEMGRASECKPRANHLVLRKYPGPTRFLVIWDMEKGGAWGGAGGGSGGGGGCLFLDNEPMRRDDSP